MLSFHCVHDEIRQSSLPSPLSVQGRAGALRHNQLDVFWGCSHLIQLREREERREKREGERERGRERGRGERERGERGRGERERGERGKEERGRDR